VKELFLISPVVTITHEHLVGQDERRKVTGESKNSLVKDMVKKKDEKKTRNGKKLREILPLSTENQVSWRKKTMG